MEGEGEERDCARAVPSRPSRGFLVVIIDGDGDDDKAIHVPISFVPTKIQLKTTEMLGTMFATRGLLEKNLKLVVVPHNGWPPSKA